MPSSILYRMGKRKALTKDSKDCHESQEGPQTTIAKAANVATLDRFIGWTMSMLNNEIDLVQRKISGAGWRTWLDLSGLNQQTLAYLLSQPPQGSVKLIKPHGRQCLRSAELQ